MSSVARNRDYYEALSPGREDYWRYMAAPRMRVARILSLLRRLRPRSIVDLGCGNGALLEEIRAAWPEARLAGVDLSVAQTDANRARMPGIEWIAADLQQPLAASEARFEAVVASEIIEHLDRPELLLQNAARMADRGGRLILTTQSGPLRATERRVGHVRHFEAGEMRALLGECGWTPVEVWNEGFPFHDLSKKWANRDPDASMQRFGGERYGMGERAICFLLRAAFAFNSRRRGAQLFALAERTG